MRGEYVHEAELLKRISIGDEGAFNVFFQHHWKQLYNYLFKVTKSHEISEELVFDVFMKMWTGREMLTEIHNMEGFLMTVAHNKAMDFFRLSSRHQKLQKAIIREMSQPNGLEADYRILDEETRQILREAVRQLSPQRKLIFTLSKEQGLSHEEIASRLNLSHQTVKNTLKDALKSIRAYLKTQNIDPVIGGLIISCLYLSE